MRSRGLGYIGIDSTEIERWQSFATDILGMMSVDPPSVAGPSGSVWLKMDQRHWRVAVHPSDRDGCAYVGWEYADPTEFNAACAQVEAAGVTVKVLGVEDALARGVRGLARFDDPWGNTNELFFGAGVDEE